MENNNSIKWQALEYEYTKKSPDWFWALWIVSIGIIVASIFFDSISFAILIFIITFTLSIQAVKKPKIIDCEVSEKSIEIYGKKYLYENLESYWIKTDDGFPRIIIKPKKTISRFMTIPLDINVAENVDEFLEKHLEKKELEEPLLYLLAKYF